MPPAPRAAAGSLAPPDVDPAAAAAAQEEAQRAADAAQVAGATPAGVETAAADAAEAAGLTEKDADVLIDRMVARGMIGPPQSPELPAGPAVETPAEPPVEVPPEPPRRRSFAERFVGRK
jgi:hypothetical protein